MLLEDTNQIDEQTPLIFLGRSLEYNRAEKSISLTLPSAFYLELLGRYGLEDATATSSPADQLEQKAPRWTNIILDAKRTKLYQQTVGTLLWSSLSRPDKGFAVQNLSKSFLKPTEHDEKQLVNVLRYLKGTQHYGIRVQPPRRWERAKSLELLAFSATSWSEARRSNKWDQLVFRGSAFSSFYPTSYNKSSRAWFSAISLCNGFSHKDLAARSWACSSHIFPIAHSRAFSHAAWPFQERKTHWSLALVWSVPA